MIYDHVIVGAGSAGAVLAARLSEDPTRRVLLVEAGPDYASREQTPADLLDSRDLASLSHDWQYSAAPVAGRRIPYRRGKVSGGTSAINAAAAQWGRPEDFAAWVDRGNPAWSWQRVLPAFRKLETDPCGPPGWHGTEGPVTISRYADDELIPVQRGFQEACVQAGFAAVGDHNADTGSGVGPWPLNRSGTTRISSAISHLEPARGRANLIIRAGTTVLRVLFEGSQGREGRRASGVELSDGQRILAAQVLLCAGSIGSPSILVHSGIGPAQDLRRLGISCRHDAPGVGANLWDHAAVPVYLRPLPGQCVPGRDPRFQVLARCSSAGGSEGDDLQLVMTSHLNISGMAALLAEAGVPVVAVLRAALMLPVGCGRLQWTSNDPSTPPDIELNYLAEESDRLRLRQVTRTAWQLVQSPPLASRIGGVLALDEQTIASDAQLDAYMRAQIGTYCHALGTARMGRASDAGAVVDEQCRVHGIEALRVVDASVMPVVPRVVPNLTVMMIAERVAGAIDTGVLP